MESVNLEPILRDNMAILFVPLNPPPISNSNGHYFSRVRAFWDILYDSGLIVRRIEDLMKADDLVFKDNRINLNGFTYGISDLVRVIQSDSTIVRPTPEDVERIMQYVEEYQPRIVCLMHSKVRKAFIQKGVISERYRYGNVGEYRDSKIHSVPFPTGSNIPKEEIIGHYKALRDFLEAM